jgi:ABC-type glycerol-3-phosphate transport system substrate-binding protein
MARPYVWRYFYENLGDGWYNPSDNYVKFNSDKNIKVLEELLGFYKKNAKCYSISVPDTGIYDSITAMTWINACQPEYDDFRLISDKLSYSLLGRRIDSVAEKGNLVLLPLPSVNGKNMSYSNTEFIKGFAVSKYINENKLDAAVKLIEFSKTLAGNSTLHEYYAGIPASKSLWKESYWKKGLFSGQNAESVLVGIENDTRNDFAEILSGDDAVYEKNIRFRAICSNLMLEEVKRGSKSIKAITEIMNSMAGFFNSTMTVYGVPNGYNPNLVARGHK